MPVTRGGRVILLVATAAAALAAGPALAQLAHHPFAVGAGEGAVGHQNAFGAWLLGMESRFYLQLTAAVRATKAGAGGAATLVALSFAYGIFHAAGPGHGKAVITSYMVSNEVALRRGLVIALLAAVLQGLVATTIVGLAAFVFHATAPTMTAASQTIEVASYVGIVALGLVLVWRKGRVLLGAVREMTPTRAAVSSEAAPSFAGFAFAGAGPSLRVAALDGATTRSRFVADDGATSHLHGPGCGCGHMPDAAAVADPQFDWKAATIAVVTAGARPCSGAILVLVFALAQGIFAAGIAATFAMALGTAITTGALAAFAVLAKDAAMRVTGGIGSPRATLLGRLLELAAALAVLGFGAALLAAALTGVHGTA